VARQTSGQHWFSPTSLADSQVTRPDIGEGPAHPADTRLTIPGMRAINTCFTLMRSCDWFLYSLTAKEMTDTKRNSGWPIIYKRKQNSSISLEDEDGRINLSLVAQKTRT